MTAESRLRLQVCPSDEVTLILLPAASLEPPELVVIAVDAETVVDTVVVVDDGEGELLEGFVTEEGGVLEVGVVLVGVTGDLDPEYFRLF